MLCRIRVVQIRSRKHVLDYAKFYGSHPGTWVAVDYADQESICPGRSKSWTVVGIDHADHVDHTDHTDHTDHMSELWNNIVYKSASRMHLSPEYRCLLPWTRCRERRRTTSPAYEERCSLSMRSDAGVVGRAFFFPFCVVLRLMAKTRLKVTTLVHT